MEYEWLATLSTISPEDVDYTDYVECAQLLVPQLTAEVYVRSYVSVESILYVATLYFHQWFTKIWAYQMVPNLMPCVTKILALKFIQYSGHTHVLWL